LDILSEDGEREKFMALKLRFITAFIFIITSAAPLSSQQRDAEFTGSLSELRDKHRVWLIVRRTAVLDARGAEESVLSEVYKQGSGRQNYPRTYNLIARKLNKYMREQQSITAASSLSDADFIVFFNVLEIRRPLGTPYAYGELFVILNARERPRILWKTKTGGKFVDDAVGDFISEMKAARGEK
jgi:hypothetical protein